jgi:hypothetical protein
MTLQPIPSEFPYTVYEEDLIFFLISVRIFLNLQCCGSKSGWIRNLSAWQDFDPGLCFLDPTFLRVSEVSRKNKK